MADYRYQGHDRQGGAVKGLLSAESEAEALKALRQKGIRPELVTRTRKLMLFSGVPSRELSAFTRQFATLLNASLPMDEAIAVLSEQTENRKLKSACDAVLQQVKAGGTLASALEKHPAIFGPLYCAIVRAGEAAGVLDSLLARLAQHLERMDRIKRKVQSALAYPALVSLVAITVVAILMVFVVPTFRSMFEEMGRSLPWVTAAVVWVSDGVRAALVPILILLPIILLVGYRLFRSDRIRIRISALTLSLPLFGPLLKKSAVARFSRTLGTLISSSIPLLDALKVVRKGVGNRLIETGIEKALKAVESGEPLHRTLSAIGVFPPLFVRMVAVGEKTGNLPEMLEKTADYYEDEVNAAVDGFMSVLEPVLIVALGVVIGLILVAMYLPLFEITTEIR